MSAFVRPTLAEIVARVEGDFISRLPLTGAVLRRAVVRVLALVIAGCAHMLYGYVDWVARQIFPDQSEDAQLVRQASLYGIAKTAPTFATATVTFTGTTGATIPANSVLVRSDAAEFKTLADVTLVAGTGTQTVTASLAGALGTLTAGVVLTMQSPIAGVNSTTTVLGTLTDGTDRETTEALRVRLLAHMAEPAHGGTVADYIEWAKKVAGVTRAWVTPLELGPGTVVVRFVRDNDVGSIIPDAGEIAVMQAALNLAAPAHATVTAFAPVDTPITYSIAVVPNTTAIKAAVTLELADFLKRTAAPGVGVLLSSTRTTIGNTDGLTDYTLSLVNGVTPADVVSTTGQLPSLGTITWI